MGSYPTINSFTQIQLSNKRPFVLCDIDDTVLHYKYSFQYVYNMIKNDYEDDPDATTDFILEIAKQYYFTYQEYSNPMHTDLEGFNLFLKRIEEKGGEFCFLTARGASSNSYTREQLSKIGINHKNFPIHYCAGVVATKGDYIQQFIDIKEKEDVIFIDDSDHFISSVLNKYPDIRCYKFNALKTIFELDENIV